MDYKSKTYMYPGGASSSWSRQLALILTGILALLLTACGSGSGGGSSGGGGGGANAQCTLTADQLENLTPAEVASLPAACDGISIFDVPAIVGLFILGTEIDGATGELKLYVHGVKQNGQPMTIADFEQAALTVGGTAFARPADWDVASVTDGSVLSMAMLADYSTSITDADLEGIGDLYDIVLNAAPAGFEAEIINFSSLNSVPAITVKPGALDPHWTDVLNDLLTATDLDPAQSRENTTLYDAMGTGLMGPLDDRFDPFADSHGLVERGTPATLLMVQTDGKDNNSLSMTLNEVSSLIDRCHTTAIMLGTFRSEVDAQVLEDLAGTRGATVNALNTNFLEEAITSFAESLGNLVVFTVSPDTLFAGKTVVIDVGGVTASAVEPFDIDGTCQLIP